MANIKPYGNGSFECSISSILLEDGHRTLKSGRLSNRQDLMSHKLWPNQRIYEKMIENPEIDTIGIFVKVELGKLKWNYLKNRQTVYSNMVHIIFITNIIFHIDQMIQPIIYWPYKIYDMAHIILARLHDILSHGFHQNTKILLWEFVDLLKMSLEPSHESIFNWKTDELSDEIKMTSNYSLCNPIIELESRSVWLWNIDRFHSDYRA